MKAQIKQSAGPRRRRRRSAKMWKEPQVSIYVGVTLAIMLATAVRVLLDR